MKRIGKREENGVIDYCVLIVCRRVEEIVYISRVKSFLEGGIIFFCNMEISVYLF